MIEFALDVLFFVVGLVAVPPMAVEARYRNARWL